MTSDLLKNIEFIDILNHSQNSESKEGQLILKNSYDLNFNYYTQDLFSYGLHPWFFID